MSVLQSQPSLSISTNECKQQFLTNEINEMKVTKDMYLDILDELKSVLKDASSIVDCNQMSAQSIDQNDLNYTCPSVSISIGQTGQFFQLKKDNDLSKSNYTQKINNRIKQFTQDLQNRVNNYCSSQISRSIVKFIDIQKQQSQFHPLLTNNLTNFIKNHQKNITQRQKKLQQIQDFKYLTSQNQQNKENVSKLIQTKSCIQKNKKSTEKTISSFDFNNRLMEVVKKQITFLNLKKRKLQIQIEESKKNKTNKDSCLQVQQNFKLIRNQQSTNQSLCEQLNAKRLPGLRNNDNLRQNIKPIQNSNNDTSAFEKIVMVYQKDKFINALIEQKILKLQKKLTSQRKQNQQMDEKTNLLQKQLQKLDWSKVCDQSFAPVPNKKLNRPLQLSILDRTFLNPTEQRSIQYSQMSINQSMIKKF